MGFAENVKLFFVLVKTFFLQLWCPSNLLPTTHQQEPPTNPNMEPRPVVVQHNHQWQNIIMTFCFTSALEISLHYLQNEFKLPSSFHILSFVILLTFAFLFIAKSISLKFPVASQLLEKFTVFMAVTTFFYTIAIPFPLSLKCATWVVYAVTILTVMIMNSF